MLKIIKKADVILVFVLVMLSAVLCVFVYGHSSQGAVAVVKVDGEEYGRYELTKNQVIDIGSHNQLTVKDGKIMMTDADCPDKYCLNQHRSTSGIDASNQTIVCLPNKVVVSIESDGENGAAGGSVKQENADISDNPADISDTYDAVSGTVR